MPGSPHQPCRWRGLALKTAEIAMMRQNHGLTPIPREELRKLGGTEAERAERPKGDRTKLERAVWLRRETAMTLKWTAGRLRRGTGARAGPTGGQNGGGKGSRVKVWN